MNIAGSASIFLLTACILSYGLSGAFAASGSQEVPLSVESNLPAYSENSEVTISGKVRDSSLSKQPTPVVIMVLNPDGGIVTIAQANLDSDNEYSVSMVAGGPLWKASGEYTVKAQYGAQKGETTFTFTGGSGSRAVVPEPEVIVPEPEAIIGVPKGAAKSVP